MQIFMSLIKGNLSNKYVTALYCLFQYLKWGPVSILPKFDGPNAFFPNSTAPGPIFRIVGKSLILKNNCVALKCFAEKYSKLFRNTALLWSPVDRYIVQLTVI